MAYGICEGTGHNAWGCKKPLKAMKKRQRSAIAQSSKGKQPTDSLKSSKGKKSFDVGQTSKIRQATSKRMRTLISENSEDEVTQTQRDSQLYASSVTTPVRLLSSYVLKSKSLSILWGKEAVTGNQQERQCRQQRLQKLTPRKGKGSDI
ncbi:uncharacterized protein LOC132033074 [Lycium ferocissimum]|uniref:uncharacterized protein LOC132033074 n=1 Tax=Lycium ferocissimum TaxID=112874 RepID=UPI002815810A|nr:uncharacterized protein LOC132033074 [Lycium ferocissimum]